MKIISLKSLGNEKTLNSGFLISDEFISELRSELAKHPPLEENLGLIIELGSLSFS